MSWLRVAGCLAASALFVSHPAAAQSFRLLVSFDCGTTGCAPNTPLIAARDGNLYGLTSETDLGTEGDFGAFRLSPLGAIKVLGMVHAPFVMAADGNFYGTVGGGAFGQGSVYRMSHTGAVSTVYSFDDSTGWGPFGLAPSPDGSLFSITMGGGVFGGGTLVRILPTGDARVLRSFREDEALYVRGFFLGRDGLLYGTSYYGGVNGVGCVFRIDRAGAIRVLYSFPSSPAMYGTAYGDVMQASDGSFYGTMIAGGHYDRGVVFRIRPSGVVTVLHSFRGPDGAMPYTAPIEGRDGYFYGTTHGGGVYGYGVVYRMDRMGHVTVLHSFDGAAGAGPVAGVVQGPDGAFYGTTAFGGHRNQGTAFRIAAPHVPAQ